MLQAALGISKSAIIGKVNRLGLPKPPREIKPRTLPARPNHFGHVALPVGAVLRVAAPPAPRSFQAVRTCQFIEGDVLPGGRWRICGETAVGGKSYCAQHAAICYTTTPPISALHV